MNSPIKRTCTLTLFAVLLLTPAYCKEMMKEVRDLQPGTIVNSRLRYSGPQTSRLKPDQLVELRDIGVDYLTYRDREIPEYPN